MLLQYLYQSGEMDNVRHRATLCRGLIKTSLSNCLAYTAKKYVYISADFYHGQLDLISSTSKGSFSDYSPSPPNSQIYPNAEKRNLERENISYQTKLIILSSKHKS